VVVVAGDAPHLHGVRVHKRREVRRHHRRAAALGRDRTRRLSSKGSRAALAERFARLTADRRARLLTFLAAARRRQALAQAVNR
jgi:hypothetical protein